MKIKLLTGCADMVTGKMYSPGTVIDVSDERAKAAIDNGLAEVFAEDEPAEEAAGPEKEPKKTTKKSKK
jgi:hypothetical protein